MNPIRQYARWLHTQWPAGRVEKLPLCDDNGRTNVPGVYIAGDLRGIPLLKFSADSGARVVETIAAELHPGPGGDDAVDVAIVGGGVAGMAAALEARRRGLTFVVLEANEPFSTVVNFPKAKPIFTYPRTMTPSGALTVSADVKEALVDELRAQTVEAGIETENARVERVTRRDGGLDVVLAGGRTVRARRVVCALGRSGNFRRLGVPGENLPNVYNRLHDPADFRGRRVLVVGGGDSAVETAMALVRSGARVTLCHRGAELSRPKPENVEALDRLGDDAGADATLRRLMGARVTAIHPESVEVTRDGSDTETLANDVVFTMIGREAPLDFFRRSGVRIRGEWTAGRAAGLAGFLLFCLWLYHWKAPYAIPFGWHLPAWLDPDPGALMGWLQALGGSLGGAMARPSNLLGTLRISASSPGFYYTLAYSVVVVAFGVRRIRYRRTPYVTAQTLVLMAIQVIPLFILPEIILPWLGHNGAFDGGFLQRAADGLFPRVDYGHGREYWRAYGLVLAWPLDVWNWFTNQPLWWWIVVGFLQTFVAIPVLVYFWGKGAYCGWICSCGALAETLGDRHREKMVHGSAWNRLNMAGQAVLLFAVVLLGLRIAGWIAGPASWPAHAFTRALSGTPLLEYRWLVDIFLAGVVGYGLYFWFSGRVWCRFFCPLAALMHVYARFSRFRILAEKKKCISCNVCTSVCHQGIDVMNFANKGLAMADPECVRCSACVQSCPTGVLWFGRVDRSGNVVAQDRLAASPVRMRES